MNKKQEEKYKKKIKELKKELGMVEMLLSIAQPESWDIDSIYDDAISGIDEFTGEVTNKPDLAFARWLKRRYNFGEEK